MKGRTTELVRIEIETQISEAERLELDQRLARPSPRSDRLRALRRVARTLPILCGHRRLDFIDGVMGEIATLPAPAIPLRTTWLRRQNRWLATAASFLALTSFLTR